MATTEVQVGNATVFGLASGATITLTGYATFLMQGVKPTHKFILTEIKDCQNFDAALIASNSHIEMDMDFIPSGSSKSAAAAVAVFLTPLASVTTAGFTVTALNGRWVYVGDESMDLSNSNSVKTTLRVRKYDDSTQNTSLCTTVT